VKNVIIEEKISHILRTLDELSDIVAKHESVINKSVNQIERLMEIIASDDIQGQASGYFQDSKPPHY
jgi:SlyX protein